MVMRKLLRLAGLLLFLLFPPSAWAQDVTHLAYAYDLDSATFVYPKLTGRGGADTYTGSITGPARIKTTGSSTTVVAVTAGQLPFASVDVGSPILIRRPNDSVDKRVVVAKASGDSVTVDVAIDLDTTLGFVFSYYNFTAGTAATSGWVDVSRFGVDTKFIIQYDQGDFATGLQYRIECETQTLDPKPGVVYPKETSDCGPDGTLVTGTCQIAVAGATGIAEVLLGDPAANRCRVGIKGAGADTSDAGAALERITISVTGRRR